MYKMLHTTTGRLQATGAFLSDMVKWGEAARIRAVTDDFTGLYNRRFFDDAIEKAVIQARLTSRPFTLAMVDLDRFGTLNSQYGEAAGDAVLQAAVSVFRSVFREKDILSRYGGDEFAFILPETGGREALERCRKLGEKLRELDILSTFTPLENQERSDHSGLITTLGASIGLAVCPAHAGSAKDLLEKADQALYRAKEAGRDCAVLYQEE